MKLTIMLTDVKFVISRFLSKWCKGQRRTQLIQFTLRVKSVDFQKSILQTPYNFATMVI